MPRKAKSKKNARKKKRNLFQGFEDEVVESTLDEDGQIPLAHLQSVVLRGGFKLSRINRDAFRVEHKDHFPTPKSFRGSWRQVLQACYDILGLDKTRPKN